jgi:endonuclease/exonuclease/phosphatase (EEP) superfamily protein YafD
MKFGDLSVRGDGGVCTRALLSRIKNVSHKETHQYMCKPKGVSKNKTRNSDPENFILAYRARG